MFQLYSYQDALTHVKVIHKACLEYRVPVRIPSALSEQLSLYSVFELGEADDPVEIPYTSEDISRDCMHPWLDIATSWLNTDIGYHMYKFSFVRLGTDDVVSLYFTYRIQAVPDDKPYIYMNREEN